MSVSITLIEGPDNVGYAYLKGTHDSNPAICEVATISRAAMANGSVNVVTVRDSLVAKLEAQFANYQASQALLQQL